MFYYLKIPSVLRYICFLGIAVVFLIMSCHSGYNDVFYEKVINETEQMYTSGQRQAAKYYLDSIYHLNPAGTPYFRMKRYGLLAHWAYMDNKYDTNKYLLDSQLAVIEQYKMGESYPKEYVDALNERGYVYLRENDLNRSFDFFSRSRQMANGTGDSCSYITPTYALGMVTYRQKRYRDAVKFFQEAYKLNTRCTWNIFVFFKKEELLLNVGLAYTNLKKYDSADKYFNSALNLTDSAAIFFPNDTDATNFKSEANGVIKGNLAKVFIAQGRTDTAIQLLKENIAINSRRGRDVNDAMVSRMGLAELYFKVGRYKESFIEINNLQQVLDSIPNNEIRSRMLHLLYLYHKQIGVLIAGEYLDRYGVLKDSMELAENELNKTDYIALLKDKDTQYRIALLTRDNEVSRLYLDIALLLSVLAAIIIAFVFRNYNRSRKNVNTLTALNKQVNEQKQVLENTMSQLRETSNEKDRILHVVAHDLRSPVNSIMALTPLITEEKLNESQTEMMEMIVSASDSAISLIDEILEYSSTTKEFATERTNVNELVAKTVALLQLKAFSKDQEIKFTPANPPAYILAHREKMGRVLSNLLTNAIKFSPRGTAIEVLVSANSAYVTIEVRDHGIGISTSALPHVFDMFTSSKRYGTDGEASFGLGLSICKQIVTAHNGRIYAESTEGAGSTFYIELPMVD